MHKDCSNCKKQIYIKPCRVKLNNYCSNKCQMVYQYAHGRLSNTSAAHKALRQYGQPKRKGKAAAWIGSNKADEIKAKISKAKKGVRIPKLQGANHHNWRGGVDKGIWFTWEYKQWRKAVFERDNYTCVLCGDDSGGNLEADHIKPKFLYPELIFDLDNGRTLCHDCHVKTPTYGSRVKHLLLDDGNV